MRPNIYFYLPRYRWPVVSVPEVITNEYIDDISHVFFNGQWLRWTFQTYLRLAASGYDCKLVDTLPQEGVVVACRADMPFSVKPSPAQVFVCLLGGGGYLPYAQIQVVQNRGQVNEWPEAYHIPHWTQPGLVPRDPGRGSRVENVAFFGHPDQLAPELRSHEWEDFLRDHGLMWRTLHKDSPGNSDYSDVDLIVAIRSFDGRSYPRKPSTKLLNAWHAGVPAILGPESEYRAERRSYLDYVEAATLTELQNSILHLLKDSDLRRAMSENGKQRATETTHATMVERYRLLLDDVAVPRYNSWTTSRTIARQYFIVSRFVRLKKLGLRTRFDPAGQH